MEIRNSTNNPWKYVHGPKTHVQRIKSWSSSINRWMPSDPSNPCPSISRLRPKTYSKFCMHWKMRFLYTGKNLPLTQTYIYYWFYNALRYLVARFGRWKGLACVARNQEKEKPQFHYFVQKRNQVKGNSLRLVYFSDGHYGIKTKVN